MLFCPRTLSSDRTLSKTGVPIEIPMVIVPGVNDSDRQIDAAAELLGSLQNIVRIRLLAYHLMAGSKYVALGLENTLPKVEAPCRKSKHPVKSNLSLSAKM